MGNSNVVNGNWNFIYQGAKYARKHGFRPGDRIKIPIFWTGITKHHLVYLGVDRKGQEWFSENHKFENVRLVRAEDFFARHDRFEVIPFVGSQMRRDAAVRRALSCLGQPYSLVSFNCEHYASFVQDGFGRSEQVENVAQLLGLAAFFTIAFGVVFAFSND